MEQVFNLESLWQEYDMDILEKGIDSLFPQYDINLMEIFSQLMTGDVIGTFVHLFQQFGQSILVEMGSIKNVVMYLLVLGILSALLASFMDLFHNHQIADISYYFVYIVLIGILMSSFNSIYLTAQETMNNIVQFIQLFIPTYLIAVGVSSGATTVGAYYYLMLFIVYGVETILCNLLLPLINGYAFLSVVNGIWIEERLKMLIQVLKKGIQFILKGALWSITGLSIFQSIIAPVLDSVKSNLLQKTISSVPGVGNMADGIVELVVGSAVVIKNSMGLVLLLLLFFLCLVPLVKILMIAALLKVTAALLGMISDKRITNSTNEVGEAGLLLFQTAGTAMVLFMITIAVASHATNKGF